MAKTKKKTVEVLTRTELEGWLPDPRAAMKLDLVGTAEAAQILGVERARIGKLRKNGILAASGERVTFPEPLYMETTVATVKRCSHCSTEYATSEDDCPECGDVTHEEILDHSKLAATPLWWAEDMKALAELLVRKKPRS